MNAPVPQIDRDQIKELSDERFRDIAARYEVDYDAEVRLSGYIPPGPVARGFLLDFVHRTTAIMGPVGSGKTTACAMKPLMGAAMAPVAWHPDDGKPTRMFRCLVLRDTFRTAEKSVLESWKQWFPKGYPGSTWTGGNDRPVTHRLRFVGNDGIRIELIMEFAGLNEQDIETMMRGREYSMVWLNEHDTHADGALDDAETRVGRYPKDDILLTVREIEDLSRRLGVVVLSGLRGAYVMCDFNAPSIDNHAYREFVANIGSTPDRAFYRQPGGLDPDAENRERLTPDYYEKIAANNDPSVVMRLVHNKFGYSRSGKPVYETFDRMRHAASHEIGFDPNLDLIVGVDLSTNTLNPAAIFMQVKGGRIVVIDELTTEHGTGAARFSEQLKLRLQERYAQARNVRIYIDPAAQYGGDREGGQLAAMELMATICELPVLIPANGSNELGLRLDAVKTELRGWLEPNSHLLVCPVRCPILIEGFEGKYRYPKKSKTNPDSGYGEGPEKNHPHSDAHDGLQYGVLGIRGLQGARRGAAGKDPDDRGSRGGAQKAARGFDVHRVGLR